jgi:hypothetical protein
MVAVWTYLRPLPWDCYFLGRNFDTVAFQVLHGVSRKALFRRKLLANNDRAAQSPAY